MRCHSSFCRSICWNLCQLQFCKTQRQIFFKSHRFDIHSFDWNIWSYLQHHNSHWKTKNLQNLQIWHTGNCISPQCLWAGKNKKQMEKFIQRIDIPNLFQIQRWQKHFSHQQRRNLKRNVWCLKRWKNYSYLENQFNCRFWWKHIWNHSPKAGWRITEFQSNIIKFLSSKTETAWKTN